MLPPGLKRIAALGRALVSLVGAVGCANAHESLAVDAGHVPEPDEAGVGSEPDQDADADADAEQTPEPPPGPDRARESESHSFCDSATGTFGIYFDDLRECFSGPSTRRECHGAEAFDVIYVLDARAGKIAGSVAVEVLSEEALYGQGTLAQLEGADACRDLTEFVLIAASRAGARIVASVFDGRRLGGASGFSLSYPECIETLQDHGSYGDSVDVFALVRGDPPLRGPEHHALAVAAGVTEVPVDLLDDCEPLLGHLAVWYRGEELTAIDAY